MNSNSEDDESQVMVMLPVGIGHVFVLLEENDWHAIEQAFTDPHVVDLEDHNEKDGDEKNCEVGDGLVELDLLFVL